MSLKTPMSLAVFLGCTMLDSCLEPSSMAALEAECFVVYGISEDYTFRGNDISKFFSLNVLVLDPNFFVSLLSSEFSTSDD